MFYKECKKAELPLEYHERKARASKISSEMEATLHPYVYLIRISHTFYNFKKPGKIKKYLSANITHSVSLRIARIL